MVNGDLFTTKQLCELAQLMYDEIKNEDDLVVSRYSYAIESKAQFMVGRRLVSNRFYSTFNIENMLKGVYRNTSSKILTPEYFKEICVGRDFSNIRSFKFDKVDIDLPSDQRIIEEQIPTHIEHYDSEFVDFTAQHKNTNLERYLYVRQDIIVNSSGGIFIQTIPYFGIKFGKGYNPMYMIKSLDAVCNSEEDIKNFNKLIGFMPDPFPDKRMSKQKTFSDAFNLYLSIGNLKKANFKTAGIRLQGVYDVIILGGPPIHEIIGHQFEKPINNLDETDKATFQFKLTDLNKNIILADDPYQKVGGYKVLGFTHGDAYGRKRPKKIFIKNGKIKDYLSGEFSDQEFMSSFLNKENHVSVGNSTQSIEGIFPDTRMSCITLDGKREHVDYEGKIVTIPTSGFTNTKTLTYYLDGDEAFVIKNGEPKRICPIMISGGIKQIFSSLVLLDSNSYDSGTCLKPSPLDKLSGDVEMASIPVSEFVADQLWGNQQVTPITILKKYVDVLKTK